MRTMLRVRGEQKSGRRAKRKIWNYEGSKQERGERRRE